MPTTEQIIAELRADIDQLDDQILELLTKRADKALKIGEAKKKAAIPIMDISRESDILTRVDGLNEGPLSSGGIKSIYKEIISACRAVQAPVRVSLLGPAGTFSHAAAISHFGSQAIFRPLDSLSEAFAEASAGKADYVLAPLENSTEGVVGQTLDLLVSSGLKARSQFSMRVSLSLMAKTTDLGRIRKVASHPQALAQCRGWLSLNLPGAELIPTASTGAAASLSETDDTLATIGHPALTDFYHLISLAEGLEDQANNQTLFMVFGREDSPRTGQDRTFLWFAAPHRSGSLYEALKPLADAGVNLTRLHSRPNPEEPWQYLFFLELDGHYQDKNVVKGLEALEALSDKCCLVGSYSYDPALVEMKNHAPGPGCNQAA